MEKEVKEDQIEAQSHPTHYLMHKYWGRKPHNVISEYIKNNTKEGDLVLDPFMGSGGVIIESKKLKRRSIGVDLNPISVFIVENTLTPISLDEFRYEFEEIVKSIPNEINDITLTHCPSCQSLCKINNAVWKNEVLVRIKGICDTHGVFRKDTDEFDIKQTEKASSLFKRYVQEKNLFYPKDKMFDYVKRNGKTHIDQLFSHRNLIICSLLFSKIAQIKNKNIRRSMEMVFTSMLPNVSKMIPADEKNVTGKSGWQISKFWVPSIHTEKNVLDSFRLRFKKVYSGKEEIAPLLSESEYTLYNKNSEDLSFIPKENVDYIFTDPPYGDSISYFALSMFWNSWLSHKVDYKNEIIFDLYRNKGYEDYKKRLINAYQEMYRVLKPGKSLSFTFHNRNLNFWKAIIDACLIAGFELKNVTWQPQAVSSGTQGINRKNTLRGDFVYNFVKPLNEKKLELTDTKGEELVINETNRLLEPSDFIETTKLYEHLIPLIVKKRAFLDSNSKILDIDKLLAKNYVYKELREGGTVRYGWAKH